MLLFIIPIALLVVIVLLIYGFVMILDKEKTRNAILSVALVQYAQRSRWKCCDFWDSKQCKCDQEATLKTHFSGDDIENGWDIATIALAEARK